MANENKRSGAGVIIGVIGLALAIAGAVAVVVCSTVSADYSLANLPLYLLGIVCAICLEVTPRFLNLGGKAKTFVPFIAKGVSVFLLARISLDVIASRILLASGLFTWNSGNTVGWSVFSATVVATALLAASAVLFVIGAFLPDGKRA